MKESGVPRDEFIVATKLFVNNFKPKRVFISTERSLNRLGLDVIDVLYLHWPWCFDKVDETLNAMSKLVDDGKIRHIAVSNYTPQQVDKALEVCDKHIIANQVEMHPWLQQKELLAHHKSKKVKVVAYNLLLHGHFKQVPELLEIAEKHKIGPAQVSLAWIMAKGAVPLPKSANEQHLKENYESLKIKLDSKDLKLLNSIEKEKRLLNPPFISPSDW
ncbi:MAG: aldo/keto reductase [Candidatus Heimdallarchaeota archaeon]